LSDGCRTGGFSSAAQKDSRDERVDVHTMQLLKAALKDPRIWVEMPDTLLNISFSRSARGQPDEVTISSAMAIGMSSFCTDIQVTRGATFKEIEMHLRNEAGRDWRFDFYRCSGEKIPSKSKLEEHLENPSPQIIAKAFQVNEARALIAAIEVASEKRKSFNTVEISKAEQALAEADRALKAAINAGSVEKPLAEHIMREEAPEYDFPYDDFTDGKGSFQEYEWSDGMKGGEWGSPQENEWVDNVAGHMPRSQAVFPDPGMYKIVRRCIVSNCADCKIEVAAGGDEVAVLNDGCFVEVLDVITVEKIDRIRARIKDPEGWISLKSTKTGRWFAKAVQADEIITVIGAGMGRFNGDYIPGTWHGPAPDCCMAWHNNGKPTFSLVGNKSIEILNGIDDNEWIMWDTRDSLNRVCYRNPHTSFMPPAHGWIVASAGQAPAPHIISLD
jgi:hypothetical protein